VTDQFWIGVIVGSITTIGLLLVWGLFRIYKSRANAMCRWCGGSRHNPAIVRGSACPSPFHAGHPDWDF
jgi:hypothetical protein